MIAYRFSRIRCASFPLRLASSTTGAGLSPTMSQRPKVVMVIGTTGSGKSKLGIDVARELDGEVINADVIQMYAGLDVASAKVLMAERQGVPHHLMSFLEPRTTFTVRDFHHVATSMIEDVVSRGKIPVVVGGTMYYCQSLLRQSLLAGDEEAVKATIKATASAPAAEFSNISSETPYARLQRVDPVMAQRLHPNDARKITRALQVFDTTGEPYSQVLLRQQARLEGRGADAAGHGAAESTAADDASSGGYDVHTIWLQMRDASTLHGRLDARVDAMVASGLLGEVRALRDYLRRVEAGATGQQAGEASAVLSAPSSPSCSPLGRALSSDEPTELTVRLVREYLQAQRLKAAGGTPSIAPGSVDPPFYWSPEATGQPAPTMPHPTSSSPSSEAHRGAPDVGESGADYGGLLQAIGYKELTAYLSLIDAQPGAASGILCDADGAIDAGNAPRDAQHSDAKRARVDSAGTAAARGRGKAPADPVADALRAGIDAVKLVTRRYAKKQDRWIRNRFASRGMPMRQLDTSDVGAWDETVRQPALSAVRGWLRGEAGAAASPCHSFDLSASAPTDGAEQSAAAPPSTDAARIFAWRKHSCDVCERTVNGDKEWADHLASRGHHKAVRWMRERHRLETEMGILLPKEGRKGKGRAAPAPAAADAAACTERSTECGAQEL